MRFRPPDYTPDPVPESAELDRVLALPRRPPLDLRSARAAALVELMTERLRRPDRRHDGTDCGCRVALGRAECLTTLYPEQAWTLHEASQVGGVFAGVKVGGGKTGVDILCPMVAPGCRLAALFVPSGLVEQFVGDYLAWAEHFAVPTLVVGDRHWFRERADGSPAPVVHVVPFGVFQRHESTTLLDDAPYDTVVVDEIHRFKNLASTQTTRFLRLFVERPDTRLYGWTGTPTSSTIRDFFHLLGLALGEGSPMPVDPDVIDRWAPAIDPSDWPAPAGALRRLVAATGARDLLGAVRTRLVETRGVVMAVDGASCGASVRLREWRPRPPPPAVAAVLREFRKTWVLPNGEEVLLAVEAARYLRQIAYGFYYHRRFPPELSDELIDEWYTAQAAWYREARGEMARGRSRLDSPFLLEEAARRARRGEQGTPEAPAWPARSWARWEDVAGLVTFTRETVWIDKWLAEDVARWAEVAERSGRPGVVWYRHEAFGLAVAEACGRVAHYGQAGDEDLVRAEAAAGGRSLVLSAQAYGTGFDGLQRNYSRALVANPPASSEGWEQLFGRLHRRHQLADEVVYETPRHTPEVARAIDRAVALAKYVEGVTGGTPILLAAGVEWVLDSRAARWRDEDLTPPAGGRPAARQDAA